MNITPEELQQIEDALIGLLGSMDLWRNDVAAKMLPTIGSIESMSRECAVALAMVRKCRRAG